MKSAIHIILDPHGDNQAPPSTRAVRTPIEFLKSLSAEETVMFVQGEELCRWATDLARVRGWPVPEQLLSPIDELRSLLPSLDNQNALEIVSRLGTLSRFCRPLELLEVASGLWPDGAPLWRVDLSKEHLAEWLVWRWRRGTCDRIEGLVLDGVCKLWESEKQAWGWAFSVRSSEDAWAAIVSWVLGETPNEIGSWPIVPFPFDVLDRLGQVVQERLAEKGKSFFFELVERGVSRAVLGATAVRLSRWFEDHPRELDEETLRKMGPCLSIQKHGQLRQLLLPPEPAVLPRNSNDIYRWFTEEYLPYREWGGADEAHRIKCLEIGKRFGEWYLRLYSHACCGGPSAERLGFAKTNDLKRITDSRILLIILDGATFRDASRLVSLIREECPRLSLDDETTALGTVPTITEIAKTALRKGASPEQCAVTELIGADEREDVNVRIALNRDDLKPVIWRLEEPDFTYHRLGNDPHVLKTEVEGRLTILAKRIGKICHEAGQQRPFRLIVTSDHGRMIGPSKRTLPVPPGMQAHGRSAWGGDIRNSYDVDGLFIDGEIAWLNPQSFGLEHPTAIVLSDSMFLTQDGRVGVENHPHGGVFPEEVLIPWIQMTRDRGKALISAKITGKGVADQNGFFHLSVKNPEQFSMEAIELEFTPPLEAMLEPFRLPAMTTIDRKIVVNSWPSDVVRLTLRAALVLQHPDGKRQKVNVDLSLETEDLYRRDDILGDL